MPSPSSPSDSIAYFTCVGLGLFATAVPPAYAGAVEPDDSNLLSLAEANVGGNLSVPVASSTETAAEASTLLNEGHSSQAHPTEPATVAVFDTPEAHHENAFNPSDPLFFEPDAMVPAATVVANADLWPIDPVPDSTTPLPFTPLASADPVFIAPPAPPMAVPTPSDSPRPADASPHYAVITRPAPTPVISITAAPAPPSTLDAFDPAAQFTYQRAPLSSPALTNAMVIETPPDTGSVALAPVPVPVPVPAESVEPSAQQAPLYTALPTPEAEPQDLSLLAQSTASPSLAVESPSGRAADLANPNRAITDPIVNFQAAFLYQEDDLSARGRLTAIYPITSYLLVGGSIDLTEGDAFIDSELEGVNINELYVTVAPPSIPNLRFTLGQIDLTSYFDRNSFAKDAVTHFFNPIFQTNPALATSGVGSRQGIVANWAVTDDVRLAVAGFSSDRSISDFELDAVAAELGLRLGNGIIRGTYVNNRESGTNDGPADIFGIPRGGGEFGVAEGDREEAFGINGEYFIPEINLGLFARFGHYNNRDADFDANTVSGGINLLDVFTDRDRLGLAYGENLSGGDDDFDNANVLELFYDLPIRRNLRAGVTLQQRDDFSDTVVGFRIRSDFNILP